MADLYKHFNRYVGCIYCSQIMLRQHVSRLSLKECKGHPGSVPTVPVSHDGEEFIHSVGVIFLKSIKGRIVN